MTINTKTSNNSQRTESFFDRLNDVLQNNDVATANTVARRIKALAIPLVEFPIPEACASGYKNAKKSFTERMQAQDLELKKPPLQIARFHQRVIDCLEKDATEAGAAMRKELASDYFTSFQSLPLHWPSQAELAAKSKYAPAFYYHVTNLQNLETILKTGEVLALQALYFGAFVGVGKWHFKYGDYALAFNKSIERLSPLSTNQISFEAGFLKNIPVNPETLNHIVLLDGAWGGRPNTTPPELFRTEIQAECKKWSGKEIPVLFASEAMAHIEERSSMKPSLPKEWNCIFHNRTSSANPSPSRSDFLPSRL